MNNKQAILIIALACMAFFSCKKETAIQNYESVNVTVAYKNFVGGFPVSVYVDTTFLGEINPADLDLRKLFPATTAPMKLSVKRSSDGSLLFDTTFVPQTNNKFTLFISDVLNVYQLYTPPATQPDAQHFRIQLYHRVTFDGAEIKSVDFKFFTRSEGSGPFTSTPYELKNVPFGKLSDPIDLPVLESPNSYYVEGFNPGTGDILVPLFEDYGDGLVPYNSGGTTAVLHVKTIDYPPDGVFFDILDVYPF